MLRTVNRRRAEPGAIYRVTESLGLAFEGLFSVGSADWKQLPFSNSGSKFFNPSIAGAVLGLHIGFGESSRSATR